MAQAAEKGDRHLAFMSLESLNEMLNDISSEVDIGTYDVLSAYDPGDLRKQRTGLTGSCGSTSKTMKRRDCAPRDTRMWMSLPRNI